MQLTRYANRSLVAVVIMLLAAGTAIAANPTASHGPNGKTPTQPSASTEPSESPDASESSESAATSEAPESPEASESPEPSESPKAAQAPESPGASPAAAELSRIVDLLKTAGITTTESDLSALAAKVGVGGAVRVLAFAHASGKTPAEILGMFTGGMGWGQIARQLNLSIGPGIGWIMSGGHGKHGGSHGQPPH